MNAAWPTFRIAAGMLTDAQLDEKTASGWTYRQMLGHVAGWHELARRRISEYRATGNTQPSADAGLDALLKALGVEDEDRAALTAKWDMDRFNASIARASLRDDRHVLFTKLDGSFARLRDEAAQLTDEQVGADISDGRPFAVAVIEGDTYGHYPEHEAELAGIVPATGTALAERIERDWRPFRERVRHLGRAGLAERIAGGSADGWKTHRELIAHVIGWLEDVPRHLESIRAGTHRPISGQKEIDEYNARSVSSRALVGPEALLDELEASYRRVREAVLGLSDEEVRNFRIAGMVYVRTFVHWDEHSKELGA
ncbi:MAG TPA: maleylpyruvate isomerase N-terminal domain-containing protein [Planctomycetota bacterium]|nr:maleylpyruvate isomerase N-terminal domain-containing protein [Planctomycetota bacterium]